MNPPAQRPRWRSLCTLLVACTLAAPAKFSLAALNSPAAREPPPVLINIAQIKQLVPEAAGRGLPVRLQATVLYHNSYRHCYVRDSSGAIFVDRKAATNSFAPGDVVLIEGATAAGDFAPIVRERNAVKTGVATLPPPRQAGLSQLASGEEDCNAVETGGVVRSARYLKGFRRLDLELAAEGRRVAVRIYDVPETNLPGLVDTTVRLRGVASGVFNWNRQIVAGQLVCAGLDSLTIEEPASPDAFAVPLESTRSLFQSSVRNPAGHRVRVRGVVLYQHAGRLFLRDEGQGLQVLTVEEARMQAGDRVEAVGFPAMGRSAPLLEDAVCRKLGSEPVPEPVRATVAEILRGRHDAELVSLEARLVERSTGAGDQTLLLQSDGQIFSATLPARSSQADLLAGSRLQLTGICVLEEVLHQGIAVVPQSFRLLLRSPAHVLLLQAPPWWTPQRILWAAGLVMALLAGGLAWVMVRSKGKLRAHARSRAETQARYEAVLAERNRLARELHDSLEQGLVGIAFQLEASGKTLGKAPDMAQQHLELALRLVRKSHTEVRRSIWDLRAQVLDTADLPSALASLGQQFNEGVPCHIQVDVQGVPHRLPIVMENNLLRICQEAVANAHKHAQARAISIRLSYADKLVALAITDDGRGFDVGSAASAAQGHFGLQGVRERAGRIGGFLTIASTPGEGTRVAIEIPLAAENAAWQPPNGDSPPNFNGEPNSSVAGTAP